jgi:hypothetical protein
MSEEREQGPPRPPPAEVYPPWVTSAEERHRWDLCLAVARQLFLDPQAGSASDVWLATRSLYQSDLPT